MEKQTPKKPFSSKPIVYPHLQRGIEHAQTGKELALRLNIPLRRIVSLIAKERSEGLPICSDNKYGYFKPKRKQDLEATIESLQNRSIKTFTPSNALQRTLDESIKNGKDVTEYANEQLRKLDTEDHQ